MAHRHQHGFSRQPRPRISAGPSVVLLATDISMTPGCIRTTDALMALSDCTNHGSQHGLRGLHIPLTPRRPSEAAKPEDVTKASVSSTDHIYPHESHASSGPGTAAWTTDTSMVSSGIVDQGDPSRRSTTESETFLVMGFRGPEPGRSFHQA